MSRYFLAVGFNQDQRQKIGEVVKNYKKYSELTSYAELSHRKKIRWIPSVNWHLTLAFLGDVEEKKITKLSLALNSLQNKSGLINVDFTQCTMFPARKPSVLALTALDSQPLNVLKKGVHLILESLGITHSNKQFIPHISFARVKSKLNMKAQDIDLSLQLTNITLFKSLSTNNGVMYKRLQRVEL